MQIGTNTYTLGAWSRPRDPTAVRRWGAGTAAIVRLLVAADQPLTQVAIAEAVGVSQPRASQVLRSLGEVGARERVARGYRGRRARLLDLYASALAPHLVEPETFWFSLRPMIEQARRSTRVAEAVGGHASQCRLTSVRISSCRGDTPRSPSSTPPSGSTSTPPASCPPKGLVDASVVVRHTDDPTLLAPSPGWAATVDGIPLTDPVQQWRDLLDLGGEDRKEAADRLRRAILDRELPRST